MRTPDGHGWRGRRFPECTAAMRALLDFGPFSYTSEMTSLLMRATDESPVFETVLPLPGRRRGKVRDLYTLDSGTKAPRLLVIATDRISAFDVVMPTPIPGKGRILTSISAAWFEWLRQRNIVADHLISLEVPEIPGVPAGLRESLTGRVMVCRAAKVVPIECVARGYLAGSGWAEYQQSGSVCGVKLRAGLQQCDQLDEPIFTPATKVDDGHDENVSIETAAGKVGAALMERLRSVTLRLYSEAAAHALKRGIILADTKFEFGFALGADGQPTDELLLIDEVLTPDSSRFWPLDGYAPGRDQPSFDKQYLRDYLQGLVRAGRWGKCPPGPSLPPAVVDATLARYEEVRDRLFG